VKFSASSLSLPVDFFAKSTGKGSLGKAESDRFPFFEDATGTLLQRTLVLQCLLNTYSDLWEQLFDDSFTRCTWTRTDPRLRDFAHLRKMWNWSAPLRTDFERRQALVEIDVLVAIQLRLDIDQLLSMYRIQFPVLVEYERNRLFDQHGRVCPSSTTAGECDAISLPVLAATLQEQAGFDVHASYQPDGSNTQELRRQKIHLGKKEAGVLRVSERCTMADLLAETDVRRSDESHPEGRPVRIVGLRYTDPGLEPRMQRVYPTPWTRCDREEDYRVAWAEFERRLRTEAP
jgi:hypothetical protein